MKRIVALFLGFCLIITMFAACSQKNDISEEIQDESLVNNTEASEEEILHWEIVPEMTACEMPEEVADVFIDVTKSQEEVVFTPIAYIGSKISNGTVGYRVLCHCISDAEGDSSENIASLRVLEICVNPDGMM